MNSIYLIGTAIQLVAALETPCDRLSDHGDIAQDAIGLSTGSFSPYPNIEAQAIVETEHTDRNAYLTTNARSIEDEYSSQSRLIVPALGTIYSAIIRIKYWLATFDEDYFKSLEKELSVTEIENRDGAAVDSIRTRIDGTDDPTIGKDIKDAVDLIARTVEHQSSFPLHQSYIPIYNKYQPHITQCPQLGESIQDKAPQTLKAMVDDTMLTLKQLFNLLSGLNSSSTMVGEGLTNRELAKKIYQLYRYTQGVDNEEEKSLERLFQTQETLNNLYKCLNKHLNMNSKTIETITQTNELLDRAETVG